MPNPRYAKFSKKPPAAKPAGKIPGIVMKTAAWPGVPGKTQSRSRAGGTRKLRQSPREEGI